MLYHSFGSRLSSNKYFTVSAITHSCSACHIIIIPAKAGVQGLDRKSDEVIG